MTSTGRGFQLATGVLLGAVLLVLAVGASSASAATASLSVQPSSYDFGALLPESGPSDPATFTVINTSDVEIPPPNVFLSYTLEEGPEPAFFDYKASDCPSRASLAPAESCTAEVIFEPFYPGPREGMITFRDPTSQLASASATLTGRGIGPGVSLSPPLLSMGERAGQGPSPLAYLTVTNDGDTDLSISGISLRRKRQPFRHRLEQLPPRGKCRAGRPLHDRADLLPSYGGLCLRGTAAQGQRWARRSNRAASGRWPSPATPAARTAGDDLHLEAPTKGDRKTVRDFPLRCRSGFRALCLQVGSRPRPSLLVTENV